ncbi:MAG TPA: flagellar biosynthetic protein FliR [Nitrospira sp.]|nr:flagellar biosynthetic protein FliR [Nitrospira sp.]HMV55836.1 flagellar biosynthetic protein FliR [Nitrospira sp.]HMW85964.1 flagellar biosynthetic protein FliR [Nitrospira sp.]HMX90392.1 flagellar biosynthetic protein FliR [Nitrospira sp.]HMZ95566.1 flagellar biosynthetic protein FliR [Nitrospira sp.]
MNVAQTLHLALPQFQSFSILLVRIAGIISVFPILNTLTIPMPVKAGLVTMLGLVLAPIIQLPSFPNDPALVVAGIGSEFLIGLTIGLAVRLLFSGFQVAGELVGTQMGFSAIQMFDPMSHQNAPIIAQFQLTLGSLVFLSLNAHLMVVHAIGMSYEFVPPFGAKLSDSIATDIIHLAQNMLGVALKMAAPVFATLLIVNTVLAILGRAVPQMNVFVLSFPITIGAGLFAMSLAMPFTLSLFEKEFENLVETILSLLKGLGHG